MAERTTVRRGRIVDLIAPINVGGETVAEVHIRPVNLGIVEDWGKGLIPGARALLSLLTQLDSNALRQLEYPDVDEVMRSFYSVLPDVIRDDVMNGRVEASEEEPAGEAIDETLWQPGQAAAPDQPAETEERRTGFDVER